MEQMRVHKRAMAILALFSMLLILLLAWISQTNGGSYTVGQLDGVIHDQAQQISECITLDKTVEIHFLQDCLQPVAVLISCFLFELSLFEEGKRLWGYADNTLVSLCIRMNN